MKTKFPTIALAALIFAALPLNSSSAFVAVSVGIAPPPIPVYEQPYCPAEGYIWTPGYWSYADFGYYWVPGVWVAPPRVGFLWTPGYWGYSGNRYVFYDGYWGPTVGFYGGINYGFGYTGRGYYGGEWVGNSFRYNTAVTRVNTTVIHNTYVNNKIPKTGSRASFNGPGGAKAKPTTQEQAAAKAEHAQPTAEQRSRVEAAKKDPALHAANNRGKPKPGAIKALDRNTGQQTAAAAGGAGSEKQTGTNRRGNAEKKTAGGRETKAGDHARQTVKAGRTEQTAAPHARKAAQSGHKVEARRTASSPRVSQHTQAAPHRPRPVVARQAGPAARERGPAGASQNAKKKKKKPENGGR